MDLHDLKFVQGSVARHGLIYIQWQLGSYCNYACTYCPEQYHDGKFPYPSLEQAKNVVDFIVRGFPEQDVLVVVSGGEPTVFPHLFEVLEYANRNPRLKFSFISNGSRSLAFYERLKPLLRAQSTLSCHVDHVKIDHFIEVAKLLGDNLSKINLPMHPDPEKWMQCMNYLDRLQAHGLKVVPKVVFDDFGPTKDGKNKVAAYNEFQLSWLQKNEVQDNAHLEVNTPSGDSWFTTPQHLIANNANRFLGWNCLAGVISFFIGFKGDLWRSACGQGGPLGNVYTDTDLRPSSRPMVCETEVCWCVTDIAATKWKPIHLKI